MGKKLKSLAISLVILLVTLVLIFLVGEFWVRNFVLLNKTTGNCMQLDNIVKFKAIPNSECFSQTPEWQITNKHNSFGLRSPGTSLEKKAGTFRILFLGDSFVQGYGVDEEKSFVRSLEKKLNEKFQGGPKIEVINAGVPNYSPLLEYLYLKQEGLKFNPDLVMLEFDLTDFSNDYAYSREATYDERGTPIAVPATPSASLSSDPSPSATPSSTPATPEATPKMSEKKLLPFLPSNIKQFFHDNSVFYKWLSTQFKILLGQPLADPEKEGIENFYTIVKEDKQSDDKLWENPKKNLKLINNLLKEKNIPFIVSAHPHAILVSGDEWSTGRLLHGLERGKIYDARYFAQMATFLNEEGVPFINLLSYFREDKKAKYFPFDGHFNTHGHEVAAHGIYQELIKLDLIKTPNKN